MIVTVTMNPALDKTAAVRTLLPGALNRLEDVRIDAGGSQIDASTGTRWRRVIENLGVYSAWETKE